MKPTNLINIEESKSYKDYEKKQQINAKTDKLGYKVVERILNDPMFKATLEWNELRGLAL